MATDYAQNYIATVVNDTDISMYNLSSVNDNDGGTYGYNSYIGAGAGGGSSAVTITFSSEHNVEVVKVLAQYYDSAGQTFPVSLKIEYLKDTTWHTLFEDNSFSDSVKKWYSYDINSRIKAVRCNIGTQSNITSSYVKLFALTAIGYDSSGKLSFVDANSNTIELADTTAVTGQKVRFFDGSVTRALRIMDDDGSSIKIWDEGQRKSLAIVE